MSNVASSPPPGAPEASASPSPPAQQPPPAMAPPPQPPLSEPPLSEPPLPKARPAEVAFVAAANALQPLNAAWGHKTWATGAVQAALPRTGPITPDALFAALFRLDARRQVVGRFSENGDATGDAKRFFGIAAKDIRLLTITGDGGQKGRPISPPRPSCLRGRASRPIGRPRLRGRRPTMCSEPSRRR